MAEEPIKPNPSVDTAALMAEVEALRKSNREILDDYKKAKEAAKAVPPDVDVDALIAFKQQKEKEELEALQHLKNWKTHKQTGDRTFEREEFLEEMVDAFNYFFAMLVMIGVTPEELFAAYEEKNKKIHSRLTGKY